MKQVTKKIVTETVDEDGSKKTVVKEHAPREVKRRMPREKKMTAKEREELLIENFVGLQHAMTNMSIKFGSLSDNLTKLLQVFEEAAKNFISGGGVNREFELPQDEFRFGSLQGVISDALKQTVAIWKAQ